MASDDNRGDNERLKEEAAKEYDEFTASDFEVIEIDEGNSVVRLTEEAIRQKTLEKMED